MCGIVAQFGPRLDPPALRLALHALAHRGPDAATLYVGEGAALGHTRLAIIAPEDGAQPVRNEDQSVIAVVSGEFYEHARLRGELKSRGHLFRTGSDSELLVHLYEEYGDDCVAHLRGEFAFVLWDERKRRLLAARDRFGVRPLLYAQIGETLCIASEAKALFALGVVPRWDLDALFVSLHAQYVPADRTLFAGIRQLRPGEMLTWKGGAAQTSTYWDLDLPLARDAIAPPGAAQTQVRAALEEAVDLRLVADAPLCVQLSGGIDSSVVAALAARRRAEPLSCFTVSFEQSAWDEAALAQATADHIGAELSTLRVSARTLLDALPRAVAQGEGLAVNLHIAAKYLLARHVAEAGYRVVLTGEGADEVFLGYAHFRQDFGVAQGLAATNRASAGLMLAEGTGLSLDGVTRHLGFAPSFLAAKATLGQRVASLLRPDFLRPFVDRDPLLELVQSACPPDAMRGRAPVDVARYAWSKTALPTYILRTLGDAMEMSSSLEGRVPMLDHVLFEAVRGLPLELCIRDGQEKAILRECAEGLVPPAVVERQKHPFVAPPMTLFEPELLSEVLGGGLLQRLDFVDASRLRTALAALPRLAERERIAWDPALCLLLSAALLSQEYGL